MAELRVRVLGGLSVDGLDERAVGSRKGRQALKVLAVAGGEAVPVDRIVDALWADRPPSRPADQVGVLVSRLRGVLGAERIVRLDAGYALRDVWLDLDELAARVAAAERALAAGQLGSARAAADAALRLARGPVLPEEDGDWLLGARAAADAAVTRAHRVAALAAGEADDHAGAAAAAEAALRHDPYDEIAVQVLLRAAAAAGRPASGLAAYVRFRERLVEELGVAPSAETEALHDQLVLGDGGDGDEPPRRAPVVPSTVGIVGRAGPTAALDDALAAVEGPAAGGRAPAVVRVIGEAGIGKSALVSAWSATLDGRAVVLTGRCDELGRDLPLQPVADAVAVHLDALGETATSEILGGDVDAVAALLGRSSSPGTAGAGFADAEIGRHRLFGALLAVIERIGHPRPMVLVLDDLHFAGPSTLAWLAFVQRRARRVLVVTTVRPGGPDIPGDVDVALGPLDRDAVAALLAGVDPARIDELHARADGNPLFLLALAGAPDGALPASVRDAARRQAAGLGPAAATVSAAAVLGGEIDLDLLADVTGRSAGAVLDDLEAALAADLLEEWGSGLAFHHELVRVALADGVPAARRRLLHRDAARALHGRADPDALAIAVHARLGGLEDMAIDASVRAADAALARYDTEEAAAQLDVAVGLGGSEAAHALRARVRMVTGDLDGAADDAARAVALGGGTASLEISAWVAYYRRRYDEARRFADAGVRRAGDDADRLVSCLAVAGRVRHGAGDLDGALARLDPADGAAPAIRGVADVWRAMCQVHRGEPTAALATLEEPLLDPDHLAHPWAGMHGRFGSAMALGYLGRPADALARCDDLDAAVARSGAVGARFVGPAANVRGWLLRHVGAGQAADDCNQLALDVTSDADSRPLGDAVLEYHYVALLDLADGRMLAGDVAGAAALVDRLAPVDEWQGTMAWHQRHRLQLLRARLAMVDGEPERAAGLAGGVAEDARARHARRYEVLARAWSVLAIGRATVPELDELVAGLDETASLEGWRLLDAMGRALGSDPLRRRAAARATALVTAAGPHTEPARRMVTAVLDD